MTILQTKKTGDDPDTRINTQKDLPCRLLHANRRCGKCDTAPDIALSTLDVIIQ